MQHVARSNNSLSSHSSEESHWRSSESSTEASYLSVLKNNVSDTQGLNFYCRRFLSLSSEELHSQSSDSSTEVSYLSVLKNNVSDTRGLNFYCRRFPQGFSSGFLVEQFLRLRNSFSSTPPIVRCFPMTQEIKRLNEDYASA